MPLRVYKSVYYDRLGECSPEKDCLWWHWLALRQPKRKSSDSVDYAFKQHVMITCLSNLPKFSTSSKWTPSYTAMKSEINTKTLPAKSSEKGCM